MTILWLRDTCKDDDWRFIMDDDTHDNANFVAMMMIMTMMMLLLLRFV